jgi:hypothetical protein
MNELFAQVFRDEVAVECGGAATALWHMFESGSWRCRSPKRFARKKHLRPLVNDAYEAGDPKTSSFPRRSLKAPLRSGGE